MSTTMNRICLSCVCTLLLAGLLAPAARADINLEYRTNNPWLVGETVAVQLYAVSDDPGDYQSFSAIRTIFDWDPNYLELLQVDQTGAVPLMSSGFPSNDAWGLNEEVPPQDGDGLYQALANFNTPVETTTAGVLVTTFLFEALQVTPATPVNILVEGGNPLYDTAVIDGVIAGLNVTGTLAGTPVEIVPEPATLSLATLGILLILRRR